MTGKFKNLLKIAYLIFILLICSLSEASTQSIVDANNKFTFDMYANLKTKNTSSIPQTPSGLKGHINSLITT